jgi:saccharopine dehydrogenase-like NADP-dependent oxidoreductase
MSDIKTLAIIGASGNVGEVVLPTLLRKTNLKITVVSRPESKATFPPDVQVLKASVDDPSSLEKAFQGQDAVLCLISPFAVSTEGLIVDAAAKAGVKYFVPSEFGHDTTDPKVLELLPIFSAKSTVIEKLVSHEAKMGWTGFVTGLFLDWVSTNDPRDRRSVVDLFHQN